MGKIQRSIGAFQGMIQGHSVLAIIPARGGSKGISKKNIKLLAGKPLIAWTIEEAKKSKYIDRLILSSEDEEIIKVAKEWGCEVPFIRPAELAKDDTPGIEPVLHALNTLKEQYKYVVLLQPTSPLRLVDDIDGCIEACISSKALSCISVTEVNQHPHWMYTINASGCLSPVIQRTKENHCRQDLPRVYVLNGAVYVAESILLKNKCSFLTAETKAYVMSKERSLDIDEDIDLKLCEILMGNV
jgi:N-acylneuraminate cytidylyltransferase